MLAPAVQGLGEPIGPLSGALKDAGRGPDADLEAMAGHEYEMREGLTQVLYEHEPE